MQLTEDQENIAEGNVVTFALNANPKKWVVLGYSDIEDKTTLVRLNDGTTGGFKYMERGYFYSTRTELNSTIPENQELIIVARRIDNARKKTFFLFYSLQNSGLIPPELHTASSEVRSKIKIVFERTYRDEAPFDEANVASELQTMFPLRQKRARCGVKTIESDMKVNFPDSAPQTVSIDGESIVLVTITWICRLTGCDRGQVQRWLDTSEVRPVNICAFRGMHRTPCFAYKKEDIEQLFHSKKPERKNLEDLPELNADGMTIIGDGDVYWALDFYARKKGYDVKILRKVLESKTVEDWIEPEKEIACFKSQKRNVYPEALLNKILSLVLNSEGKTTITNPANQTSITITTLDRMFVPAPGVDTEKKKVATAVPTLTLAKVLDQLGYSEDQCSETPFKRGFSIVSVNGEILLFMDNRKKVIHVIGFENTKFESLDEAREWGEVVRAMKTQ